VSLVSYRVFSLTERKDGRRLGWYCYTDQTGSETISGPFNVPPLVDPLVDASERLPSVQADLANGEAGAVVSGILGGADSMSALGEFRHASPAQVIKRLLTALIADPNPAPMLHCRPLIDYGLATYTGEQLQGLLELSAEQVSAFVARYQAAVAIADGLPAAQVVQSWR
jgi:hypothetical protein